VIYEVPRARAHEKKTWFFLVQYGADFEKKDGNFHFVNSEKVLRLSLSSNNVIYHFHNSFISRAFLKGV